MTPLEDSKNANALSQLRVAFLHNALNIINETVGSDQSRVDGIDSDILRYAIVRHCFDKKATLTDPPNSEFGRAGAGTGADNNDDTSSVNRKLGQTGRGILP